MSATHFKWGAAWDPAQGTRPFAVPSGGCGDFQAAAKQKSPLIAFGVKPQLHSLNTGYHICQSFYYFLILKLLEIIHYAGMLVHKGNCADIIFNR